MPRESSDGSAVQDTSGAVARTPAADPQPDPHADRQPEPQADRESAGQRRSATAATIAAPAASPPRRRQGELQQITFEDLEINMAEDTVFDPAQLTDRVKELDGQRIRIKGFISPGIFQQTGIDKFPLVMNTECKFGPGGQADHVIIVELLDGLTTSFTVRPIAVEGRLTLQPWNGPDGNTWALYHLAGEKVR